MTVSDLRRGDDARRSRLTCTWVPVRVDGRVRMEMRWIVEPTAADTAAPQVPAGGSPPVDATHHAA